MIGTDAPDFTKGRCTTADPDLFFPPPGRTNSKQRRDAKAVCNGAQRPGQTPCPERVKCLLWAVASKQTEGVLGGMTPRERRQFRGRTTRPRLVAH
jgi:WhiB family redox-sensing transcriptional regulator